MHKIKLASPARPAPATTLSKALGVLDVLAGVRGREGLPLQQIAERLGENKTSVYRWLQAFEECGLVERQEPGVNYRLGLKLLGLSSSLLAGLDLRTEAAGILHDLMVASGETVHLGVYDRGEVVYVEKVDGPGTWLMRSRVGGRMLSHCTALGKALLAYQPAAEVAAVLERGLVQRTPNTIVDPGDLLRELEKVRRLGYALDNEENEQDIACIGAPVFDHAGRPAAAISISRPLKRALPDRIPEDALKVRAASEALSARLGHRVHR